MAGYWDDPLFFKSGWVCDWVEDLGKDRSAICEMCAVQSIRFIHHLSHPIEGTLRAGCVCAGRLEGDQVVARDREQAARSIAERRERFIASPRWKRSKKGSLTLRQNGLQLVIRSARSSFKASALHGCSGTWMGGRVAYRSIQEACGALFDVINSEAFKSRVEALDARCQNLRMSAEAARSWEWQYGEKLPDPWGLDDSAPG